MKPLTNCLVILLAFVGLWILGCGSPAKIDKPKAGVKNSADPIRAALEMFRQSENVRAGDEWTRYRGGFDQLKNHFAKDDVARSIRDLTAKNRAFLDKEVRLSPDELAEIELASFHTPDAHYLDECFLLREAARSLEVPGSSTAEKARLNFRWVMRNVLPHEQIDSWTPPAFTLRRGYGSPLERALVFLALLRQSQIDGCLIVVLEAESKQFLVAAIDANEASSQAYLFDTRLGLPLVGKDGTSLLTLKEARAEPALLQPAWITEAQSKKLEARLVCPLYALSARMYELQKGIGGRESTVLYMDAEELAKEVAKATALKVVKVWNPPLKDKSGPNSPTRSLRQFLPSEEGGIDETGRIRKYTLSRVPMANIVTNLAQIKVTKRSVPRVAFELLLNLSSDFINKYDLQVREMHLRGEYDTVVRRHERLQLFARNDALIGLVGHQAFAQEVEKWRKFILDADAADKGQPAMLGILSQDLFYRSLFELEKEKIDVRQQMTMTVVTRMLAVGMRDHLDFELALSRAAGNHEKAEHAQAVLRAKKEAPGAAKDAARDAWVIARNSWENAYLERIALQTVTNQKLQQMQQVPLSPENLEELVGLLETLHLDVHKYFHARLRLAECLASLEGVKASRESLLATKAQIEGLEKDGLLLKQVFRLKSQPGARHPELQQRLELIGRDWDERGSYFWMKQQIDRMTGR